MIEIRTIYDKSNLDLVFRLRKCVFVEEQGVPEDEEIDVLDDISIHVAGFIDDKIVACGRMYIDGNISHWGRICVLSHFRNKGFGKILCEYLCELSLAHKCKQAELNSQLRAIGFYEKMGFKMVGDKFLDAGITHVKMVKDLK